MIKILPLLALSTLLFTRLSLADDAAAPAAPATSTVVPDEIKNSPSYGSLLGINLAGIAAWSTEFPFSDVFHQARAWISQQKGQPYGKGPALELDEHGWVKKLDPDCYAESPVIVEGTSPHVPKGPWTLLYEGEGDVTIWPSNNTILSQEPGKITFEAPGNAINISVLIRSTDPNNYVRNIHMIWPGMENTWKDQPYRDDFLAHWKGFNTIRFMDWGRTNNSPLAEWADRPKPDDMSYIVKGPPLEVMIDLCNHTLANPWICIPHLASDDYVHHVAQYIKENLKPGLKVHIEYSNEVWNDQFGQSQWAAKKAMETANPEMKPWEARAGFYVRRSLEIFKIFEQEFGGTDRLVRLLAWQAAADPFWTDGRILSQPGVDGHVDALAIAPYFPFLVPPTTVGDHLGADQVSTWTLDQLFDHLEKVALPQTLKWMQTQKGIATKHGVKLIAYESGQHLLGVRGGENNVAMLKLFEDANRDPRMGAIYKEYLDNWKNVGGDTICLFSSVGIWSKWGMWGLLEYHDQTGADVPKYQAVVDWNAQNRR